MTSSSTQQAVSSLNSLVDKSNPLKRKRRETILSVQIDSATKTAGVIRHPALRQRNRDSEPTSSQLQRDESSHDIFDIPPSPPKKHTKSRDTRSTDEVSRHNPSSNRRIGLRSANRSATNQNQADPHHPRQHASRPRLPVPSQQKTRPSTTTGREMRRPPPRHRFKSARAASEEGATDDNEAFETAEEGDGEGREESRSGSREANSRLNEHHDGEVNNDGERRSPDEFDGEPFSLHKQGTNWRVMVIKAQDIEKDGGRPRTKWARSLVEKIHQITEDLKKISTRDHSLDDIATLEARVNQNLIKVDNMLKRLSLPPVENLQEEEMTTFEDQVLRFGDMYRYAIPALILFLQKYFSCRFRDSTIETARLEELVTWQDSTLHLCDQARKWNAWVTTRHKSELARSVKRLIKVPLQTIRNTFNDELTQQKIANDEAARQMRAEKEFRQFDMERRVLEEAKKARYEQYLIESRDFFPRFMRNYKEGLRHSSVPDRPSKSQHPAGTNGTILSSTLQNGIAVTDTGSIDPESVRAKAKPVEEDPWSEEEETYLIDALTQYKGNDRMKRILDVYGGPGGVLQHRGLGDLRRKVIGLRTDLATNPETLDIMGLV